MLLDAWTPFDFTLVLMKFHKLAAYMFYMNVNAHEHRINLPAAVENCMQDTVIYTHVANIIENSLQLLKV